MLTRRLFLRSLPLLALPRLLNAEASAELRITVERGAWGQAGPADIAKVAEAAAGELWKNCPHSRIQGLRIYHRTDYPQTDFGRGPDGRIAIGLAAENPRWAQFAFQFAHEFCHALAQHSEVGMRGWHESRHANLWLEESLCETASLFALRRMAETWSTRAPYPNWRSYAPALASYAEDRLAHRDHQLPAGQSFAAWFAQNENGMRANGTQRAKNTIVAARLLPIFEAAPENWEAVTFLNHGVRDKGKVLARKLADWRAASPSVHRSFLTQLAAVFSVRLAA